MQQKRKMKEKLAKKRHQLEKYSSSDNCANIISVESKLKRYFENALSQLILKYE